jgi:prophage maintenance system killer protein
MAESPPLNKVLILPSSKYDVSIPTKEFLIFVNKSIIEHRKIHGRIDPFGIRNESELDYLYYRLNNHKYSKDKHLENAIHISSEILYTIACRHPFLEGNKSTAFSAAIMLLEVNLKLHVNRKTKKKYQLWKTTDDAKAESEGKTMELIAKWGEGSDQESLKKMLIEKDLIKKTREPKQEDVKNFIKQFLNKYILE